MYELYPYYTNDGSVGLYSPQVDDVYHSAYGALSEAYEKFILPAELQTVLKNKSEIKILDLCYGIGYNSKSFLNYIFENFSHKKNKKKSNLANTVDAIGTNNANKAIYNDPIDDDNISCDNSACPVHEKLKIFIKGIDTDKKLFFLSPFFRTGNNSDRKHNKLNFHYEKISKFLKKDFDQKFKLKKEVNIILLLKIIENFPEILENDEITQILNSKKYAPFFDPFLKALFEFHKNARTKNTLCGRLCIFLHNIYYRYVSSSYKKALKCLTLADFTFGSEIGDARTVLTNDNNQYNYIFLDAFTPVKCPSLWTVEFFKLLFERLDENGMILTYTNSSAVKNAFLHAGFFVGKIYSEELKKFTGTIAVRNKSLIKHELTEYDLGLIKSKAGIFYRDKNLRASDDEILKEHDEEVEVSNLVSSSRYIKAYRRNNDI